MVSIPACHAGDPGSIPGLGGFFLLIAAKSKKRNQKKTDPRGNRTPNLRVWNPTRCHCAMESSHVGNCPRIAQLVERETVDGYN